MAGVKQVIERREKENKMLFLAEALILLGFMKKDLNKVDNINCKLYTD
mgnify:CR=1 FL=1